MDILAGNGLGASGIVAPTPASGAPGPSATRANAAKREEGIDLGIGFDGVTHAYVKGIPVVRDVSLRVDRGEVVCLLGPSGCGKSTLLRLAAGLETLQQGRIAIGGATVANAGHGLHVPPERRRTGLMFQDYALFPHLTVFDNIAFGIRRNGNGAHDYLRQTLDRWGMAGMADTYPHALSGGQQQRCALLRALAPKPDVLLLDEPFSGLDVVLRAQVREETLALLKETDVATVIVTHDPEEAMYMADRLLIMRDGQIVQEGRPAEIYRRPTDRFVVTLFGPVNRFAGQVKDRHVASPFGAVAAGALADGTGAEVLIRPEGLRLCTGCACGVPARVISSQFVGRASSVALAIPGMDEPARALMPGIMLPVAGSEVSVRLDPEQSFVFAAVPGDPCPADSAAGAVAAPV